MSLKAARLRKLPLAPGRVYFAQSGKTSKVGWQALTVVRDRPCLAIDRTATYWFVPQHAASAGVLKADRTYACLLIEGNKGRVSLHLPLPGTFHQAWIELRDGVPGVAWRFENEEGGTDCPVLFESVSLGADTIVDEAVAALRPLLRTYIPRQEKSAAPFIDWFGWCTWDAFYQKVSLAKVTRGLKSLAKAGFPPRFLLLDDGWQDNEGWSLRSMTANSKFPGGLARLTAIARDQGVRHVGVWHTLQGYWHGVAPGGPLAERYEIESVKQTTTLFSDWPPSFNPQVRHMVSPDDIARFYDEFYAKLAANGVDFTKVDGQAALPFFCGEKFPALAVTGIYQSAMQGAVANHMPSGSIHCMANSTDILWRMHSASVWRNSDDYYPAKPFDAQAKHLVHNAYNAVLTGAFAIPDWDMFHSKHPLAMYHAAARAISGGPVYVSDKPGAHDVEVLKRLVLPDGRIPRFSQPARPPRRWLFNNPLTSGAPLCLVNRSGPLAVFGIFNCRIAPTEEAIELSWSLFDIFGTVSELCVIHDPIDKVVRLLCPGEMQNENLKRRGGFRIWTVSPLVGGIFAPLGLEGYIAAAAGVGSVEHLGHGVFWIGIRHRGTHLAWAASPPASVSHEGKTIRSWYDEGSRLLRFEVPGPGSVTVTLIC